MAQSSYQAGDVGIPVLGPGGHMQGHSTIPGDNQRPRTMTYPYHVAFTFTKQEKEKQQRRFIKHALYSLDGPLAFKNLAKDVGPFKSTLKLS